ncbi:APBB2 isoform 31, partial [Pan troglodytes]
DTPAKAIATSLHEICSKVRLWLNGRMPKRWPAAPYRKGPM